MLKYGEILNISSGNSKTLIPRNLTYNYSSNSNQFTGNNTTSSNQNSSSFDSANITNLEINTLSIIPNTANSTNIVVSSPIAFSLLKADYQSNNFTLYPIFFSEDILIRNKNFILTSNNVTIKDNVFMINSELINPTINNNSSDNIISGFIFPIADQNTSTGYYAGLLYFPNNKITQISANSSFYNWSNNQYNYFTNINKGFFKLKYLPKVLSFSTYDNQMDQSYTDLIENNTNLANLQVNALALNDGEIVSINNTNIVLNLSDGNTIYNTINITKTAFNILNNLSINFVSNLFIKDQNNNQYMGIDSTTSLISYYQNILFNNNNYIMSFLNQLSFNSGANTMMQLNNSNNTVEIFGTTLISTLKVLTSFELNNIPFNFINSLNIDGNNNTFISFDAINNTINMLQSTYINNLIINNSILLSNNSSFKFASIFNIEDINSNKYILFDETNRIVKLLMPTIADIFTVNSDLILNAPLVVSQIFTIKNNQTIFTTFDINNTILYNTLYLNTVSPQIMFQKGSTLNISDNNQGIILSVDSSVTITGPTSTQKNGYLDISNEIINSSFNTTNSSFNITNTLVTFVSANISFLPVAKSYILSGLTQGNATIILQCLSVIQNVNNICGKIIGTTYNTGKSNINPFMINIWSYVDYTQDPPNPVLQYDTLKPITVNINNISNNGDWIINNIYLTTSQNIPYSYDLNIQCIGSQTDNINAIIWGFKLEILQI
jgi:hypothetical protein